MSTQPTVFARSKEIEMMVVDSLSVEEFLGDLRSLTVAIESYCLSPVEEERCLQRFDNAVKRARLDEGVVEYSAEGVRTGSARILQGLQELIERLLYELSVFWTESFGHAKRLRASTDDLKDRVSRLRQTRPKKLLLTGEFGITRVLSPSNSLLKVPVALVVDLKEANKAVLGTYSSTLNQWLTRIDDEDRLPPAPNFRDDNALPGKPTFYARDNHAIVWGIRYQEDKIALDPVKSQMQVGTREQLLKICDVMYEALDQTVSYQREWHITDRALKKIIRDLKSVGSEGYEAARARKLAYAAASLPRQWARYGLYVCAQLTRYVRVCLDQFD